MGQFGVLLWKNFRFCWRHPIKTALFYITPAAFISIVILIVALMKITYLPNCDYRSLALLPNSGDNLVKSLICVSDGTTCRNTNKYDKIKRSGEGDSRNSTLCPWLSENQVNQRLEEMKKATCAQRKKNVRFIFIPLEDFVFRGEVLFFPKNTQTSMIMENAAKMLDSIGNAVENPSDKSHWNSSQLCYTHMQNRSKGYKNREEAMKFVNDMDIQQTAVWGMIDFTNSSSDNFQYTIMTHFGTRDSIATLYLQNLLEAAIIQYKSLKEPEPAFFKLLPARRQKDSLVYTICLQILMFSVVLGISLFSNTFVSELCYEKSEGLLEFLFIAGMKRWTIKLSWYIFGLFFAITITILIAVLVKFPTPKFIEHTDFSIILVLEILFGLAWLSVCFCVASMSPNAQRAATIEFIFLLAAYLVDSFAKLTSNFGYTGGRLILVRILTLFHPAMALEISYAYIIEYEKMNMGATWRELNESPDPKDGYGGIMECMLYLGFQTVFYMLWSLYFDFVAPSKYGLKYPWYFCVVSSFWKSSESEYVGDDLVAPAGVNINSGVDIELTNIQNKKVGISTNGLTKRYGDFKAVDELTIDLYANEITALLGHNGAGKSTAMNMLTGMTNSSSGKAIISGKDIRWYMKDIRRSLGFCPQYDIIYPELTVKEHMQFYGNLKNLPADEVKFYYTDIFTQMKLDHALDTAAKDLSGGMKRKLSVAIAFLGHPTTIILDEPTSAIDPFSRRAIWDVILQYGAKATILLSTHYMQEADVLGDRIAVMDKGKLRCYGSPMYLKSKYGSGVTLQLAHQVPIDHDSLSRELNKYIEMSLQSSTMTETKYLLSVHAGSSLKMVGLLHYLESHKDDWNIVSFGVSEPTMEQVFFSVTHRSNNLDEEADQQNGVAKNGHTAMLDLDDIEYDHVTGCKLFMLHVWATWVKRFHMSKFSKMAFVLLIFAPLFLIAVLLLLIRSVGTEVVSSDWMEMTLPEVSDLRRVFYHGNDSSAILQNLHSVGLGTRCVEKSGAVSDCKDEIVGADYTVLRSGERLYDVNGKNITKYLLTSDFNFIGGIEVFPAGEKGFIVYKTDKATHQIWTGVNPPIGRKPTSWENAMHPIKSVFLNAINNVLLRSKVSGDTKKFGITLYTEEAAMTDELSATQQTTAGLIGFFAAMALVVPISLVLLVLVEEVATGNRALQVLMGLHRSAYWLANFIWDLILFIISLSLVVAFMAIFSSDFQFNLGMFFATSLLYGISMILFSYHLSFLIDRPTTAVLLIGLISPFFAVMAMVFSQFREEEWYRTTNVQLDFWLPPYCVADALIILAEPSHTSLFEWDNLTQRWVMAACFILFMVVLLFLREMQWWIFERSDAGCFSRGLRKNAIAQEPKEKDMDVLDEENRVLEHENYNDENILIIKKLFKAYNKKAVAVKGVSFGVRKGESFGLLGVNGAGKTTLFKILTGFLHPTSGKASINGISLFPKPLKAGKFMSYCPQQDVLFEKLSPTEHLELYGRIRGIPARERKLVIHSLTHDVGLSPYLHKQSTQLSGGNKRKLNFAIAVLDFPRIIFLDEMTTGMDPKARRATWNCLEKAIARGCAAVITTHSMEECEALCNRIVIMVNGSFMCIGGIQYLKDKHGNNYSIKIRMSASKSPEKLFSLFEEDFPNAQVIEKHTGYLEFQIAAEGLSLSRLYKKIHDKRQEFGIPEFAVSQTTLEHIFVNMVRDQE